MIFSSACQSPQKSLLIRSAAAAYPNLLTTAAHCWQEAQRRPVERSSRMALAGCCLRRGARYQPASDHGQPMKRLTPPRASFRRGDRQPPAREARPTIAICRKSCTIEPALPRQPPLWFSRSQSATLRSPTVERACKPAVPCRHSANPPNHECGRPLPCAPKQWRYQGACRSTHEAQVPPRRPTRRKKKCSTKKSSPAMRTCCVVRGGAPRPADRRNQPRDLRSAPPA